MCVAFLPNGNHIMQFYKKYINFVVGVLIKLLGCAVFCFIFYLYWKFDMLLT